MFRRVGWASRRPDSGVPPESSANASASSRTDARPSSDAPRETRATAGGTPTLPRNTPSAADAKTTSGPSSRNASAPSAAPREWLVSKTASVPPPADALEFQGSKYKLVQESLPWSGAKVKAEAMGGHLATITSRDEQDWLVAQLPKITQDPNGVWLGGFAAEGSEDWCWTTGNRHNKSRGHPVNPTGVTIKSKLGAPARTSPQG